MSGVWALLPAKCFHRGKTRLSAVLPPSARVRLARHLFDHVLGVALASPLDGVLVTTDCPDVAARARRRGALALVDRAAYPSTIERGLGVLSRGGVGGALVLMSDLPRLVPADITAMVRLLDRHARVIAPDRRDEGTNALALHLHARARTHFGHADSFARHVAADAALYRSTGLGLDVDLPRDLV